MKIYLNVSCLNRPFDERIRLEAAAVGMILERVDEGEWIHVSSEMARLEIEANPDPKRQARVPAGGTSGWTGFLWTSSAS